MNNKIITLKVTGSPELVNAFTDYLPLDLVESTSGRYVNNENHNLCHRFIRVDGDQINHLLEAKALKSKQFIVAAEEVENA